MPVAKGRKGVRQEMHKFKEGELHSGSKNGPIVKSRKQAEAIALNEAGMGKPVSKHEHTHHSVETDSKGKQHHRVHHSVETTYEYPKRPATPMNKLLDSRGY